MNKKKVIIFIFILLLVVLLMYYNDPSRSTLGIDIKSEPQNQAQSKESVPNTCPKYNRPPCSSEQELRKNSNGDDCCYTIDTYAQEQEEEFKQKLALDLGITAALIANPYRIAKSGIKTIKPQLYTRISTKLYQKSNSILKGVVKPKFIQSLSKILAKTGTKVSQFTAKSTINSSTTAARTGATVGAKIAASAAKVATVAGVVLLAFDIISLTLDIADPGGFDKARTSKFYLGLKASNDKQFGENIINDGGNIMIGPLDYVSEENLENAINTAIDIIISQELVDVFYTIVTENLSEDQAAQYISMFIGDIDMNSIRDKVMEKVCKDASGLYLEDGTCTFNRNDCISYPWPISGDADPSTLFVRRFVDGKCIMEDPTIRMLCDEDGLEYDFDKGICKVNSVYCQKNGQDWAYDPSISQYDCVVPGGQQAMELIFGTTIVRGLKSL